MKYALAGRRQGFEIRPTDDICHCPDGYTEVRRGSTVVGVYLTALLADISKSPELDPTPIR